MSNHSSATSDRRIFIIADPHLAQQPVERFQCVPLFHPKHGKLCRYLLCEQQLLEVQIIRNPEHLTSAFVGDYVQEDGCVHLATPIDPLFLSLPILSQARGKTADHPGYFLSYSAIFNQPQHFPHHIFTPQQPFTQLVRICDEKDGWDEKVYRLNDERLLEWLRSKVAALHTALPSLPSFQHASTESILLSSLSLVGEYLSPPHLTALLASYSLTPLDLKPQAKPPSTEPERVGADSLTERAPGGGGAAAVKGKKKPTLSSALKKLQQVNTASMPSLASMWGGKKK